MYVQNRERGFQLQKVTIIVMLGKVQIVKKMAMTLCAIMILSTVGTNTQAICKQRRN